MEQNIHHTKKKYAYRDLIHTGPGTLAGRYMRMFWQPVFRALDLGRNEAVPIRIMSETFTLYRGNSGNPFLVAPRCAHRGTQLSTGEVEGDCIRCHYHGWKIDGDGRCVEQPGEDESFAKKVKIRSYPTREYLGLIFAYLGEGPAPQFRRHPDLEKPGVLKAGMPEFWPCNYFNRCENGVDSRHVPFVHRESTKRANRNDMLFLRKLSVEETEYGIRTTKIVPNEIVQNKPIETVHFHFPNTTQVRVPGRVEGSLKDAATLYADRLLWFVPVDDENCVTFVVDLMPVTGDAAQQYEQRLRQAQEVAMSISPNDLAESVLNGRMKIQNIDQRMSPYYLFWVEDYVAVVGQGSIADRENERLGQADQGIILLRKIWARELRHLMEGQPLKQWKTPAGLADETVVTQNQET